MPYVIIAVLIIGGIVAFIVEEKEKEKKNLKKFPPGTGKILRGKKVTTSERFYGPEHLLWENNFVESEVLFYRYEKESRSVRPGEAKNFNNVVVTIDLEYWLFEPVPPAKE